VLPVDVLGMAVMVRDVLGSLVLIALFVIFVNASERTPPKWLRPGGSPLLWLQTKEGRERLRRVMQQRSREDGQDEPPT
jgi:hypothetical protein